MTQTATVTQQASPPAEEASTTTGGGRLETARQRLVAFDRRFDPYAWLVAVGVAILAGALRLQGLAKPSGKIFDEVYYATDAHWLVEKGFEWDEKNNSAGYVVHPPLGKWLIGLGEMSFGYNEFGWRISAAVFGTISVLMMVLIAWRLFGSVVLGAAAGLLLAFDGMHFVLSRVALLDIFLMFFILAAFGALVLDRDARRRRWATFIAAGGDPAGKGRNSRPPFEVPWWRLLAAVLIGCALAVKWSALAFLPVFVILVLWWEAGIRRTAGARHPIRDALLDEIGWLFACLPIILGVYLATWTGWFLSDDAYYRHWLSDSGDAEPPVIGALWNLWHYHEQAMNFHTGLETTHTYQSWPWQWLLLGRPVAFHWSGADTCGAEQCASEVLLLGTPVLWWAFIPALAATLWFGIERRDWRAAAILAMSAAALLPWFYFALDNRTMFYFYALPATPFLILAVVYVLGSIMTSPPGKPQDENRQLVGTVIAGAFVLLVVLNFAYFHPIFTGDPIPYSDWSKRMWLGNRWI